LAVTPHEVTKEPLWFSGLLTLAATKSLIEIIFSSYIFKTAGPRFFFEIGRKTKPRWTPLRETKWVLQTDLGKIL